MVFKTKIERGIHPHLLCHPMSDLFSMGATNDADEKKSRALFGVWLAN